MNIGDYIASAKKKPWTRRVEDSSPGNVNGVKLKVVTQDDFLNEVCSAAHPINSPMMSRRPIWGPTGEKDKNGKEKWGIVGYDDVEVTPTTKQEAIIGKKIAHFSGDGFWVANETKDEQRFSKLMSWFDIVGIKTAFSQMVTGAFRTGDAAIYIYQTDDPEVPIDYEVYDYEHGSTLYPKTDFNGKQTLARKYCYYGKPAVDIFTTEKVETWMLLDDNGDADIVPIEGRIKSDDGYTLVRSKDAQAGSRLCQCVYFRVDDIPTGPVQLQIEKLEDGKTYVGEHLKGSTMPILFLKAEKTTSLPPNNLANKAIGIKGTADSLAHADAKWLTPPDASNIATLHLDGINDDIKDGAMSVFIDPEIIKQGSDSSATMQILYDPEIQWAMNHWFFFFKPVRQLMLVFKALVGKVEQDVEGYDALRISVGQNIYIPRNKKEALQMELDQVYAGTKSIHSAMNDSGNTHLDDYEQILREKEDEKKLDAKYNTKSEKPVNPSIPNVTNQAKNQPKGK